MKKNYFNAMFAILVTAVIGNFVAFNAMPDSKSLVTTATLLIILFLLWTTDFFRNVFEITFEDEDEEVPVFVTFVKLNGASVEFSSLMKSEKALKKLFPACVLQPVTKLPSPFFAEILLGGEQIAIISVGRIPSLVNFHKIP